ncbi:MAG: ComEC/Rec2 family competence protein [Actinomycetota bacterium]
MIWHGLALAASGGAWLRWSAGWWLPLLATGLALWRRSVALGLLSAFVLAGWLGHRADAGLDPPPASPVEGWVTLTSDPRPSGPVGVRASARWGEHRVSLSAHGPIAGRLDDALAGQQVRIIGSFRPARSSSWTRWRHEVGTITVSEVVDLAAGSPLTSAANQVRRLLQDGAGSLGRDDRAVFSGMVVGDDREQSAVVADDFRAAGLGHLLVVSGQNVAFVLMLAEPLLRRVRPGVRLVAVVVVLVAFLTLTRFEASVLRASVMAGAGVGAAVLGSPIDGRRALSASVSALVLIDPFLVRVLAFQLSVLATGGIVWGSAPLAERLPGPLLVRVAAATTIAAQLAVAPLLIATFGPIPLAGLPANLLAGPVSGPVMMWGCTGGLVAGVVGGPVAAALHLPTDWMVGWIRGVAATSARAPAFTVGWWSWLCFTGAAVGGLAGRRHLGRFVAPLLLGAGVVVSASALPSLEPGVHDLGRGVSVHQRSEVVVELRDPGRPGEVLETLRGADVRRVDVIVATDGDRADADAVVALRVRFPGARIVAPPMHRVPGARSLHEGTRLELTGLRVESVVDGDVRRLAVVTCPAASCVTVRPEETP